MITGFGEQYNLNLLKLSVLHGGKIKCSFSWQVFGKIA